MYGIRVYEVRATKASTQTTRLDVADPLGDGVPLRDRLATSIRDLSSLGSIEKVPSLLDPHSFVVAPGVDGDPQTTFLDPDDPNNSWNLESAGPNHLYFRVEFGHVGEHRHARGGGRSDPIHDRAATTELRVLVLLPASGLFGRLVVEVKDRLSPLVPVIDFLGWSDALRASPPTEWVRLRVEQKGDLPRLRAMAEETEKIEVELSRKRPRAAGGNVGQKLKLITEVTSEVRRQNLIEAMLGWLDDDGVKDRYVDTVQRIAGFEPMELEEAGLTFNQASVVVTDPETGKKKRLNPESIRAKFTYSLSDKLQPPDDLWLRRTREILSGVLIEGTDIRL